jgi:hypothetical protein
MEINKSRDIQEAMRWYLHKQLIAEGVRLRSRTRVLLVFSATGFEKSKRKFFEDCLRDHIGHVLLYLRSPRARSCCQDAIKEWRHSTCRANGS